MRIVKCAANVVAISVVVVVVVFVKTLMCALTVLDLVNWR